MPQDVTVHGSLRHSTVEIRVEPTVVTERDTVNVVEVPDDVVVIVGPISEIVEVISVGIQGPIGPTGPPGAGGGGGGSKFAATVGDGVSLSYPVVHSLSMTDVQVEVFRSVAPFDQVFPEVQHTDANTVTVVFIPAPTLNQFRVVVIG